MRYTLLLLAAFLPAQAMALPTIVEMFTSKFCPSCPAAEKTMAEKAAEDSSILVILENVDYWDRGNQKDPHGKPEFTQRQYDYSNTLAERPGKVFTPQPVLNGSHVVEPPLWMRWEGTLKANRLSVQPKELKLETTETGGLAVTLPEGMAPANSELWILGYEPIEGEAIHRATGLADVPLSGIRTLVPASTLPKGKKHLVMVQEPGLGKILAAGIK
jgi:hypothetical protein